MSPMLTHWSLGDVAVILWVKALDSEQMGVVWANGVFCYTQITYKTIIGYTSYSLFRIQYLHMVYHTHILLWYKWWPRSSGSLSWSPPLLFTLNMVTGFNPFRPRPNGRHFQIHLQIHQNRCVLIKFSVAVFPKVQSKISQLWFR